MLSAIILAGGKGNKFHPFSTVRNKVCFPILGKPSISRLVSQIISAGVENIVVVTGYREQTVRNALKNLDCVKFLSASENNDIASSIRQALELVDTEDVLITYGDIVTSDKTFSDFIKSHKTYDSDVSILVAEQSPEPIHCLRVETLSGTFKNFDYDGKSPLWFCYTIIGKTSIIKKSAFEELGHPKDIPVGAMPNLQGSLISMIETIRELNIPIAVLPTQEFVVKITHPWDALEANQRALQYLFSSLRENYISDKADISDSAELPSDAKLVICDHAKVERGSIIKGNLYLSEGSQITKHSIISENVFIGRNTIVAEYAKLHRNTIVGNNNLISHTAELYGLTLDNVFMVHNCCISGIVGCNVDIGAGTISATWRFDNKTRISCCEGRKETPPYHGNLTYIGDFCRTGVGVLLMPGVRIGAYSCLGPGTIIRHDIPTNTLILCEQKQIIEKWGPDKYENF